MTTSEALKPDSPETSRPSLGSLLRSRSHHKDLLQIFVLWLGYVVAVEMLSSYFLHDVSYSGDSRHFVTTRVTGPMTRPFPALARWDSVWYVSIAIHGYGPTSGPGINNVAMMPMYGWLIRGVMRLTGGDPWEAGIWISRFTLLGILLCFGTYLRQKRWADELFAPLLMLLVYPSAYTLLAIYSDSLFLFLVLLTFVLFEGRHYLLASVSFFFAGMTRLQVVAAGLALGVLALERLWRREKDAKLAMLTPIAGALGFATVLYVCHHNTGDALAYFHRKAQWGMIDGGFKATYLNAIQTFHNASLKHNFGALQTKSETLSALLLLSAAGYYLRTRNWSEATLCVMCIFFNGWAGTLWGLPRYTTLVFPLFMLLGKLRRWPGVFYATMLFMVLMQVAILLNFVNWQTPAP